MAKSINCYIIESEDGDIAVLGAIEKNENKKLSKQDLASMNNAKIIASFVVTIPEPKVTKLKGAKFNDC